MERFRSGAQPPAALYQRLATPIGFGHFAVWLEPKPPLRASFNVFLKKCPRAGLSPPPSSYLIPGCRYPSAVALRVVGFNLTSLLAGNQNGTIHKRSRWTPRLFGPTRPYLELSVQYVMQTCWHP